VAYSFVFSSSYAAPLIDQLMAIIQRDQASALGIVNADRAAKGNQPLEPIKEFHKGPGARMAMPWLTFAAGPVAFDRDKSQQIRKGVVTISLVLDTGQFDQEMAQDNAHDYARMLDGLISTSWEKSQGTDSTLDWKEPLPALPIAHETRPQGVTAPPHGLSVDALWITDHTPGTVTAEGYDKPVYRVVIPVLIEFSDDNRFESY